MDLVKARADTPRFLNPSAFWGGALVIVFAFGGGAANAQESSEQVPAVPSPPVPDALLRTLEKAPKGARILPARPSARSGGAGGSEAKTVPDLPRPDAAALQEKGLSVSERAKSRTIPAASPAENPAKLDLFPSTDGHVGDADFDEPIFDGRSDTSRAAPVDDPPSRLRAATSSPMIQQASLRSGDITDLLAGQRIDPDAPVKLLGIRIRYLAQALRIVLIFNRAPEYAVRLDRAHARAYLDMSGASASYFQSELNVLDDPRVSGIWLRESDEARLSLEFRLTAAEIDVEDFSLTDPPVIVVDFFSDEADPVSIPDHRLVDPSAQFAAAERESLLPGDFVVAAVDHGVNDDDRDNDRFPSEEQDETLEDSPDAAHQGTPDGLQDETSAAAPRPEIFTAPQADQYDGFPIEEIRPATIETNQIFNLFLDGRWATVLARSLEVLQDGLDRPDLPDGLYLMAEARYQLGRRRAESDTANRIRFYREALRGNDQGRLGAFGGFRLGELYVASGQYDEALYYLQSAADGSDLELANRAKLTMSHALVETERFSLAMGLISGLKSAMHDDESLVELNVLEGKVRLAQGDIERAWGAFEAAEAIDPVWWRQTHSRTLLFARTADEAGSIEKAMQAYEFGTQEFDDRFLDAPDIFFRYADFLRRRTEELKHMGAVDTTLTYEAQTGRWLTYEAQTRRWYRLIMDRLRPTPSDSAELREARRRLREFHGAELARGLADFALFQMAEKSAQAAMAELIAAHSETVVGAAPLATLRPAVEEILEPYMNWAVLKKRWPDVIAAWRTFGPLLRPGFQRNACLSHLTASLAALRLDGPALEMIDWLIEQPRGSGVPTEDLLFVWKAEILTRSGRPEEVLERLEGLARRNSLTKVRSSSLRVLSDVYLAMDRGLEAAQTLEDLARSSDLKSHERGEAWSQAARLYRDAGLIDNTIDIGLKALGFEELQAGEQGETAWGPEIGDKIRLLLARAYFDQGDFARCALVLEDYLARPSVQGEPRAVASYLLVESRTRTGQLDGLDEFVRQADEDKTLPRVWTTALKEINENSRWERP